MSNSPIPKGLENFAKLVIPAYLGGGRVIIGVALGEKVYKTIPQIAPGTEFEYEGVKYWHDKTLPPLDLRLEYKGGAFQRAEITEDMQNITYYQRVDNPNTISDSFL